MWPCLISFNKTVRDPRQLRLLALNIRDKYRQLTTMLSMLAFAYGKIVDLRNKLYDKGIFEVHDLGARSISIGNLTTGGTGKTPLVAYVAGILAARGEKVCVLTRGYGRRDESKRVLVSDSSRILADVADTGDEPYGLAQELLGKAIVIADADRASAGEWARRKFGVTVFVLDDGFQHRKLKRDVDIVCVDATDPFSGGQLLPAGRLRESTAGLARADVVVITRANLVTAGVISDLRSEIADLNSQAMIFEARNETIEITPVDGSQEATTGNPTENTFAFCGIGNPNAFFNELRRGGCVVAGTREFPDHYQYTQRDVAEIERTATQSGAVILITTGKDAVKLSGVRFHLPCFVAKVGTALDDPERFAALL